MKYIPLYLLLLLTQFMFSQEFGTIKGTILDKELNNDPLLFANISLKDTDISTLSNFHGNYELSGIAPGNYTLVVSYLGYESLELSILVEKNDTTVIQRGMQARSIAMEEFVQKETARESQFYRPETSSAPGSL